ncbi:MAG: 4Fe-4S binding protein [Peptostreptococcaceae bacterium]
MKTKDYLKILKDEIHSVTVATVDSNGLPQTRIIDIMLVDDESLYFITAKGKEFYDQLMKKKYVSISGMCGGEGSLNKKAISIRGKVENIGQELLEKVFEENKYMEQIYPQIESRVALEVFRLYEGQGEYFNLSTKPITRNSFAIGKFEDKTSGYIINDNCNTCGACISKCPTNCIVRGEKYTIIQENCLHCGNCYLACKYDAIDKK